MSAENTNAGGGETLAQVAAAYEARVAAVPEVARRFAEDTWGKTWAHAEMGSLLDFADLSAQSTGSGGVAAEPVAWMYESITDGNTYSSVFDPEGDHDAIGVRPLYEHPPVVAEPVKSYSKDFQLMLVRIIQRYRNGRDLTDTLAGAEDLLKRKGSLSVFRTAEPLAAAPTPPAGGGETDELIKIAEGVRNLVRAAWQFIDDTEYGPDECQPNPEDWLKLNAAAEQLKDLIPEREQPAQIGHAVTMLIAALKPKAPASPAGDLNSLSAAEKSLVGQIKPDAILAVIQRVTEDNIYHIHDSQQLHQHHHSAMMEIFDLLGVFGQELRRKAEQDLSRSGSLVEATPAAPRKGPSEEEIARALYEHDVPEPRFLWPIQNERMAANYRSRARAIADLLTPADRGETQAVGDGWQPISTAVRDDRSVDLGFWVKTTDDPKDWSWVTTSGWYERAPADRCWYSSLTDEPVDPTHWRPQVKPPYPDQNRGEPDQGGANTEAGR